MIFATQYQNYVVDISQNQHISYIIKYVLYFKVKTFFYIKTNSDTMFFNVNVIYRI